VKGGEYHRLRYGAGRNPQTKSAKIQKVSRFLVRLVKV
jgi:hypothetical protein